MANFDAPSREQSCTRRERSNTPMQALQLMNDVQYIEAARVFAQRLITDGSGNSEGPGDECVPDGARTRAECRGAGDCARGLPETFGDLPTVPGSGVPVGDTGETKPNTSLQMPELAAWTLVCNLVLNLDEALTQH